SIELCDAELNGPAAVAAALGVSVPSEWPPPVFEADDVERVRRQLATGGGDVCTLYYIVLRSHRAKRELVGVAGFVGAPTPDGVVEIGYAILGPHQRRGYATEA